MHLFLILVFIRYSAEVGSQKSVKVHSYDSMVAYLTSGADVRYFFNTSICNDKALSTEADIPIFGGEVKLFLAYNDSDEGSGQTIFSHVQYTDEIIKDLSVDMHTLWITNDTAMIFWGKPGFFVNNTADMNITLCNWTKGEGNIWVKPHRKQKQLGSFKEIKTMLTSGETVRWVVNSKGCQCPQDPDDCGDGSFGNIIKDFKIMKDGSITFSASTIFFEFFPWQFTRLVSFGQIYQNNTATFRMTYFDPTTWKEGDKDMLSCPLGSNNSMDGANFFINGI